MSTSSDAPVTRDALFERLAHVSLTDERSIRRRLHKARTPQALAAIAADVERAAEKVSLIDAGVPPIDYPESLPVSARRSS